jgi:hypothetical protein
LKITLFSNQAKSLRQARVGVRSHQRDRGQHRHGGLAHGDHVHVGPEQLDELGHVGNVVVEVERPMRQRHQPGIDPVGDVHVVVGQHGAHGVAQQGRVVARQRRHDQHPGVLAVRRQPRGQHALEVQQLAEWLVQDHFLDHRHLARADGGGAQAEGRLVVFLAEPVQQVVAGSQTARERGVRQWAVRRREQLGRGVGPDGKRIKKLPLPFVQVVEHSVLSGAGRRS